jgi:hypothetical protein
MSIQSQQLQLPEEFQALLTGFLGTTSGSKDPLWDFRGRKFNTLSNSILTGICLSFWRRNIKVDLIQILQQLRRKQHMESLFWKNWSTLEPMLRGNGISLGLGPDTSSLVGHWLKETMRNWETEYSNRLQVVQKEVNLLQKRGATSSARLPPGVRPEDQARALAHLSLEDWLDALKLLLQHQIPLESLVALVSILEDPAFYPLPHPFPHGSENLFLAITGGQRACLVVVPEQASGPDGSFRNPRTLYCQPILTEILMEMRPLLRPPTYTPVRSMTLPTQISEAQNPGLLHSMEVVDWEPLVFQTFGWEYLALGAERLGGLYQWIGNEGDLGN